MEKKTDSHWLEQFNIKPCVVKLDKVRFRDMRIRCTVTCSEDGTKLNSQIVQTNTNAFKISIKRKEGKYR